MEATLIKVVQLILALSLLVFVHELGHFAFARLFKVRVEKFYLFFNPNFSLIRFKRFNGRWHFKFFSKNDPEHVMEYKDEDGQTITDKKGRPVMIPAPLSELSDNDWRKHPETTEWGIGWVPLGGYCKIAGMIDESMDIASLASEPQPWEYRAQKAWKRMFMITGGVLMNFITAIVIYAMMLFAWGTEYIPVKEAYLGFDYCETAKKYGFEDGDLICTVDGEPLEESRDAVQRIVIEGKCNVTVLRGSGDSRRTETITLPESFGEEMIAADEKGFMSMRIPFVVDSVSDGMPASRTGLSRGDSIMSVSGSGAAYSDIVRRLDELKNSMAAITYMHRGEVRTDSVEIGEDGKLGVLLSADVFKYFPTEKTEYGFFASIPAGCRVGWETLVNYVKQFRLVFTKAGAKSVGGFIAIGNIFPSVWNWSMFWSMTAMLSVMLAFMNILPIPVLDGGYFLMIIFEMVTGRKPSDKFMERAVNIGMFLLLALLVFANGNDIIKLFTK